MAACQGASAPPNVNEDDHVEEKDDFYESARRYGLGRTQSAPPSVFRRPNLESGDACLSSKETTNHGVGLPCVLVNSLSVPRDARVLVEQEDRPGSSADGNSEPLADDGQCHFPKSSNNTKDYEVGVALPVAEQLSDGTAAVA